MKTDIYELLTDKEVYNLALQGDEVCNFILSYSAFYKAFKIEHNQHSEDSIYELLLQEYKTL